MTDIEVLLKENYCRASDKIEYTDMGRLYALYSDPVHTPVNRTLTTLNVIFAAIAVCAVLMGAAAGYTLKEAVMFRTADLDITQEKRDEMASSLENINISPEEFASGQTEINVNEYGETYGTLFDGVDLIAVSAHENGKTITGYIYREDYVQLTDNGWKQHMTKEELESALEKLRERENGTQRNWIYVYESDGVTVIGKYIQEHNGGTWYDDPNLSEEENHRNMVEHIQSEQAAKGDFEYGFNTNRQLEDPEISKYLIYGSDGESYEWAARERTARKLDGSYNKEETPDSEYP